MIRLIESVFILESWIDTCYFFCIGEKAFIYNSLFTSCQRGSDIIFYASLTSLEGILSKEFEVFVSSLSMILLILLPVASFKETFNRPEECGIL